MDYYGERANILLVDDRTDGLMAMEVVLNSPRYRLMKASSGPEALELAANHDFAAILLDVQMPGMDGFQTAERLRKIDGHRDTPIIFVTAINKDDMYVQRGYLTGAVDYIFKPVDPLILRSKVAVFAELYLGKRKLKDQAEQLKISERRERYLKLTELELQSLKRYRSLVDAIPHVVWKTHADGSVDYFNLFWTTYTGLSQDESRGDGWHQAFDECDLNIFLKAWITAITKNESFEIECRLHSKTGEARWHWLRAVPEPDAFGQAVGWIVTAMDIQDRRAMEQSLIQAKDAADAANQAKSQFLANMSHEIRTPLGAILGFTDILSRSDLREEDRANTISVIQRNGNALLKIIDEILDLSKVEAGRIEIEELRVDLSQLLSDVTQLHKNKAEKKGLTFNVSLLSSLPRYIHTDPTRLRQLLNNLIGNSVKFTEKGSVDVEIQWAREPDGHRQDGNLNRGNLKIAVKDTGIGIPKEKASSLFQPFTQVDGSTSRRFGGTGLGLALSRKLAQVMGGNVWIERSTPGFGSTFSFTISVATDEHVEMISRLLSRDESQIEKQNFPSDYLDGMKILLAEDSEDNQRLISHFLAKVGAEVDIANDGKQALDKIADGKYDLVLLDIQMPEMDGYQAISILRERGYKGGVVAITAHALKEDREQCLRLGFDDHISKPIQRARLIREAKRFFLLQQAAQSQSSSVANTSR